MMQVFFQLPFHFKITLACQDTILAWCSLDSGVLIFVAAINAYLLGSSPTKVSRNTAYRLIATCTFSPKSFTQVQCMSISRTSPSLKFKEFMLK